MALTLKNVHFVGFGTGIKSDGPVQIEAENVTFDNVQTPWDLGPGSSGTIRGSRVRNDPKMKSTAGWKRPKGPPLPVFCPKCKSIFASRNNVFDGQYWSLWDNKEPCVICGFPSARVSEGIFDLASEAARIFSAPDATYAMIRALQYALNDVSSGIANAGEAAQKVEVISPQFAALIRKAANYGMSGIIFLSTVLGCYYAKGSYDLGKQQVQIGEEQVRLAQEANASSDQALERTLDAIRSLRITSSGVTQDVQPKRKGTPRRNPSAGEPPSKPEAEKLGQNSPPNARTLRRKAERARREALNPRHRSPPSCE